MIKKRVRASLPIVLITSLCLEFVLQGCNAKTGGALQGSRSQDIDKRTVSELFNNGISVYLDDIIQRYTMVTTKDDKLIKKPLVVSQVPFLRHTILNSKRGKRIRDCQFIAIRVEIDGKIETAEWLVTTDNQGSCKTKKQNAPRDYWVIQQKTGVSPHILLSGRGTSISIYKPDTSNLSKISTRNSATVKGIFIACYNKYSMQGGRYQLINKRVEANKPTGSMLNSHTPEMYWETVTDDPEYQCPS